MTSYALPHDWGNAVLGLSQVSLTALTGDVINERSVTRLEGRAGGEHVTQDLVDTAARIEAANNLTITAGQDIGIVGGAVQAGGNIDMDAGRDLIIASQEGVDSHEYQRRRVSGHDTSITQYGSEVKAGGNLTATAGQDLSIVASEIEARRDLALQAGRDVTLAAAANEEHSYAKGKKGKTKYERQEDDVEQQSAEVKAGGDLTIDAGRDLRMVASKASAGDEAYLVAGDKLELLAANDSQYSLYDMNKKGGWGSKKTQRDEVTDVKAVGSEVTSGGDLTLESGGDQLYQGAKLASGADLTIDSGGSVTFEAVKDMHQESHEKSNNNAFWVSSKGKGNTDETLRQTQMVAAGEIVIKAVEGLKIDVKQVDQQTVSQSIDAMVKADSQLAWLKQAETRGDVDWRQVKEIHDSFKYSNSGLGPASQIIIAIVMAAVVGPLAAGAMGTTTAGAVTAGTISVETAAGLSAAAGAVASGAATNATVSTINNRGNLGAVFKDVTSSDAMKGYAISGITAGLTAGYFDGLTSTKTNTAIGAVTPASSLSTWSGVGQFAANQTLQSGTSMLLSKALGQGGSASDALKNALFNTLAAASFNAVGDYTKGVVADGSAPKVAIHAMVGGLLAKASGGDFKTGALAAGANEALVVHLDSLVKGNDNLLTMSSQIVGVLAAASQKDTDAAQMEKGAWVAKNATQYNYLLHKEVKEMLSEVDSKTTEAEKNEVRARYAQLDEMRNQELASVCQAAPQACDALSNRLIADEPKLRELAKSLSAQGHFKEAATIAAIIITNKTTAGMTIATELAAQRDGNESSFLTAAAGTLLGATLGGMRPTGSVGAKATGEAVTQIPGRVKSRINIANGRTENTPLRDNGKPVSAGFDHVLEGHFNVAVANTRSVFTITPNELKGILQSSSVVKSPVTALPGGQFVRTVDTGRIIGTTTLKDGGLPTSVIKVFTDKAGNLISTFPVKVVN